MKRVSEHQAPADASINTPNDMRTDDAVNDEMRPEMWEAVPDEESLFAQFQFDEPDQGARLLASPELRGGGDMETTATAQKTVPEGEDVVWETTAHSAEPAVSEAARDYARYELLWLLGRSRANEERKYGKEKCEPSIALVEQGDPSAIYQLSLSVEHPRFSSGSGGIWEKMPLVRAAAEKGWLFAQHFLVAELNRQAERCGQEERERISDEANRWALIEKGRQQALFVEIATEHPLFFRRYLCSNTPWEFDISSIHSDSDIRKLDRYFKFARQGVLEARLALAIKYLSEPSSEKEAAAAFELLRPAAEQQDAIAMYALGIMLEQGIGIAPDRPRALSLYRDAAENGCVDAQLKMATLCAKNVLPPEWREAGAIANGTDITAFQWVHRAALQGDSEAQLRLAQMLLNGDGVARDPELAFEWCRKAANQRRDDACRLLMMMCLCGVGTEKDEDEALYAAERQFERLGQAYRELARIHAGLAYDFNAVLFEFAKSFNVAFDLKKQHACQLFRRAVWQGAVLKEDEIEFIKAEGKDVFEDDEELNALIEYSGRDRDIGRSVSDDEQPGGQDIGKTLKRYIRGEPWQVSRGRCINVDDDIDEVIGHRNWSAHLPEALKDEPRLRCWDHMDVALGDEHAANIAQVIRETQTLDEIWMVDSQLTTQGYRTIADAMRHNFTLRLVFTHEVQSEEAQLIQSLCRRNRRLQTLWAEFEQPLRMQFDMLPTELVELLEQHLIFASQTNLTRSTAATRALVLETLMCLGPSVLHAGTGAGAHAR